MSKQKEKSGLVLKSTGMWYHIFVPGTGQEQLCRMKGKIRLEDRKATNPIAVGDTVDFYIDDTTGDGIITNITERKNYLIRKSSNLSAQYHIIAANLDQAIIVATISQPRTSQGFIDRFLITCEAYEIPVVIVFNKTDLYSEKDFDKLSDWEEMYSSIGYETRAISLTQNQNVDELLDMFKGKITLLSGHSGVGKSTLLNRLDPSLQLKTQEISNFSNKGKHTTTFAEMHRVGEDTYVIDTPGIKEFGIVDMQKEEIGHFFPEIRERSSGCKFNNCIHVNEPDCAVLEALDKGEIHPKRFESYISMLNEEVDRFKK